MSDPGDRAWCILQREDEIDSEFQELGVVACKSYSREELVERCYCLPFHNDELLDVVCNRSLWAQWLYNDGSEKFLFAFGWGLLYNEPRRGTASNLSWDCEVVPDGHCVDRHYVSLRASRDIVVGEELCVRRRKHGEQGVRPLRDMLGTSLRYLAARFPDTFPDRRERSDNLDISAGNLSSSRSDGVEVRCSGLHGNGVFATRRFRPNEVVEVVPNLIIADTVLDGCLSDYRFGSFNEHASRIALGFGSIYNHDDIPNVRCVTARTAGGPLAQRFSCRYVACRDIQVGEELCISYGHGWWKSRDLATVNYKDGGMYKGEICKMRKRHGEGTHCYPGGQVYAGQWHAGKMHGFGRYLTKAGTVFTGTYAAGKRHGWGVLTNRSGTRDISEFQHGLVISEKIRINCDGTKAWRITEGSPPCQIDTSEAKLSLPWSMWPSCLQKDSFGMELSFLETLD